MSEIRVPTLGESIIEATISKWLKQEGDTVAVGEPLVELETDKVNLEIASEQEGVLSSIVKSEGETVAIGDVLAIVGQQAASAPAARDSGQTQPAARAQPQQSNGNGQARAAGAAHTEQPRSAQKQPEETEADMLATPVALRVAAENNIDIRSIKGSGPSGRVTKEDVVSYLEQRETTQRQPAAPEPPTPAAPAPAPVTTVTTPLGPPSARTSSAPPAPPLPQPAVSDGRREERVRMSRRRQTIARRLVEAQHTAAMLTTFNEIDMTAVMDVRKRRKEQFKERHEITLGFMSFFTRATIGALKAFPQLNAEIQGDEMVIKHYYDIGIAVGTEQGLVVPVVRDANRKSFAEIEREIVELASRARSNSLTLAELQGGTFSITNGGIYGSLMSTPILNAPQVGILGLHKIEERPVALKGEIVIRPMMYVALSYDHRIVDGSEAVRFLVRIKELMEDPELLLLEG